MVKKKVVKRVIKKAVKKKAKKVVKKAVKKAKNKTIAVDGCPICEEKGRKSKIRGTICLTCKNKGDL